MRVLALDVVFVAGVAALVYGVAQVYQPAAWILGGLVTAAAALVAASKRPPR